LGETLQGRVNGYPVYCEQISHHPPIMSFIHYGPNYLFYGEHAPEVSMGANSVRGFQKANPIVEFKHQKKKFYFIQNGFTLFGVIIGQRFLNATDRAFVFEPESRLACELIYNPFDKGVIGNLFSNKKNKIDEVVGAIYKLKPHTIQKLLGIYFDKQITHTHIYIFFLILK
jgi:Oxysterol-binding protein